MFRLVRYALMLVGLLYVWALLPVAFRPRLTGSPLRKPDPTVTVAHEPSKATLEAACEPPNLLRPIVRNARQVVVRLTAKGKPVTETRVPCVQ